MAMPATMSHCLAGHRLLYVALKERPRGMRPMQFSKTLSSLKHPSLWPAWSSRGSANSSIPWLSELDSWRRMLGPTPLSKGEAGGREANQSLQAVAWETAPSMVIMAPRKWQSVSSPRLRRRAHSPCSEMPRDASRPQ